MQPPLIKSKHLGTQAADPHVWGQLLSPRVVTEYLVQQPLVIRARSRQEDPRYAVSIKIDQHLRGWAAKDSRHRYERSPRGPERGDEGQQRCTTLEVGWHLRLQCRQPFYE